MTSMLDFSRPHLLRDDEEYDAAVAEVDTLLDLDPERGTEDFERLEFLSLLIETYETEHEPWGDDPVPPQSIVELMLEQKGLRRADLAEVMGGKARVSEFFSGKRELSREQIKGLRDLLGIPADLLLG